MIMLLRPVMDRSGLWHTGSVGSQVTTCGKRFGACAVTTGRTVEEVTCPTCRAAR